MIKKLTVILMSLLMVVTVVGCSGNKKNENADSSNTKGSGEKILIKIGHGTTEDVALHKGWLKFKEVLESSSNGTFEVQIFPNQMLGGDRELIEACQMGNIQITSPSSSPLANFAPAFYVFDMPFVFETREQVFKVMEGDVGQTIMNTLEKSGMKGMGVWENGFRNTTCNDKPRTTPEDFKGIKIRTMENDIHIASWKAIGSNPTPMAYGELFTALQQKTVDAQENPLQLIASSRFYEVQDYLIETKHIYTPFICVINQKFFDGLSEENQKLVTEAFKEATDYEIECATQGEIDCKEEIKNNIEYIELTPEERAVFAETTKPIYDLVREKVGSELVDKFLSAAADNI